MYRNGICSPSGAIPACVLLISSRSGRTISSPELCEQVSETAFQTCGHLHSPCDRSERLHKGQLHFVQGATCAHMRHTFLASIEVECQCQQSYY